MIIELHLIQNFAPSNLNRDDTNNPKDCVFGGVRRARISSQCLKRAIRHAPSFAQTTGVETGIRTRLIAGEFAKRFVAAGASPEGARVMAAALAGAYTAKPKKGKEKQGGGEEAGEPEAERTNVLVYLSPQEIDTLAATVVNNWQAAVEGGADWLQKVVEDHIKESKGRASAPDITLFGRMLADRPETNVDAACQVAHAISTHRVSMDIDFFTAVDDLQPGEETGAGMMGVTGFNSATFYRYARLDWNQLVENLYGDSRLAHRAVEGFLRAAVEAVPTGKQNSFAAHNPPSFLLGVARGHGMGWSLANAFERPVNGGMAGLVGPSVQALDSYWGRMVTVYGFEGSAAALALDETIELEALAAYEVADFETWIGTLLAPLPQE